MISQEAHAYGGVELAERRVEAIFMSNPPSLLSSSRSSWRATLNRWWCGVFAHELAMVIQSNRLSVRCRHCGYESSGWALGSTALASLSSDPTRVEPRPVKPGSALVPLSDVAQQH
jgi:hypothetical protein